jgi:hypothetical protein
MVSALAATNFLIALSYYAIAAVIVVAPIKARWVRALGALWAALGIFAGVFFFGCGSHHLDMGLHLLEDPGFIETNDVVHLLIVDGIQLLGALSALLIAVFKGDALLNRLLEVLVRERPELIQRLIDRLESAGGVGSSTGRAR